MRIGILDLDDWTMTYAGEPVRYSKNYISNVDACIILYREYIIDDKYVVWAWNPMFKHKLHFLNEIFDKSHGCYIKGTDEEAKQVVDNFLARLYNIIAFI